MSKENVYPKEFRFNENTAYEVKSRKDDTVLIALKPEFLEYEERVSLTWFDTLKDRTKEIRRITIDTPEEFGFKTPQEEDYVFSKLTLDTFRKKVIPRLNNTTFALHVNTEEDMTALLMDSLNYD
jgi:hypothetical protein